MPNTMHIVSHTHWDREWYQTFQQFRLRLVDLIDHVLDILDNDPDFEHFSLDAQTIVLEDYLAIRPSARERLEGHIRSGRLGVGPWYQLNDEFLVSGESTVRSLLLGHRIADSYGACMKIGYLPDQFGNISQMPQILRGFGIDNAIMGRGRQLAGDRKMEFWWEGPDGSRVIASLMAYWYNNAQYVPEAPAAAKEFIENLRDVMGPRSAIDDLLLMNGVDHLEAKPFIGRTAKAVDAALTGAGNRVKHSTLTAYVDCLREQASGPIGDLLDVGVGELREDRGGSCLAGTLSTRMYLKQANHGCQIALEQYAERVSAFARMVGRPYPADQLRYAWKLLMENHPHDSICGCSVDQVHDEMMPRFHQVQQVADEMTRRALDAMVGRDRTLGAVAGPSVISVFNTLNWSRTDPVTANVEFPLGELSRGNPQRDPGRSPGGFRLIDSRGADVPFTVTGSAAEIRTVSNPHELPLDQWVRVYTIEFIATDVPACGCATYTVEPTASMPQYLPLDDPEYGGPDTADSTNVWLTFEDGGDVGDEYLYRAPLRDLIAALDPGASSCQDHRRIDAVRTLSRSASTLRIPATSDASGRSDDEAECTIVVTESTWAGVPRVEFDIDVDNQASDHRLRAVFDGPAAAVTAAGGAFDVVERPEPNPLASEGALPFHPMSMWVDASGDDGPAPGGHGGSGPRGVTVISGGMPEYEAYRLPAGAVNLAVTLLRCVGQLSGRGDGPGIQTPGAQCHGKHRFRLAVFPHAGDWREAEVWKQAYQFNVPLVAVQGPVDARLADRSFVTVEPAALILSALKQCEDRDTLIVRFYNTLDSAITEGRVAITGARRCRLANLNEEPIEDWRDADEITIDVGAKKIVTVEFEM